MKNYTYDDLLGALRACNLVRGDIVLIGTALFALGHMNGAKDRESFLKGFVDAFHEILGPEGTLVVNSYTFQVARYGMQYEHEKTKCTTGVFSQFVLDQPGCLRSLHPVFSVAAFGFHASRICCDVSRSNYGAESPLDRMLKAGAKVVRLGLDYGDNDFLHYAEAVSGVPYMYNKLFDSIVLEKGIRVEGPFMGVVRYLDLDLKFDFSKIKEALNRAGIVKSAVLGEGYIHVVSACDYTEVAIRMLKHDPYAFLSQPPKYVQGRIPFDGITQGRDGVA